MLLSLTLAQYLILSGCDGSGGGGSAQEIVTTMGKGPTTYGRHKDQTTTMRYQSHWIFCLKRSCCWFLPRNISCQYTVLRSVDLWIKGSVKSRTFLLRRRACFPSPSGASHGTLLSRNTSGSVDKCVLLSTRRRADSMTRNRGKART